MNQEEKEIMIEFLRSMQATIGETIKKLEKTIHGDTLWQCFICNELHRWEVKNCTKCMSANLSDSWQCTKCLKWYSRRVIICKDCTKLNS